jgi:hypothetical protein
LVQLIKASSIPTGIFFRGVKTTNQIQPVYCLRFDHFK